MAQDIQIAGAIFNAVPSIVVPVAGGGSATFVDPSPTTAAAADVASGKLFFDALGVLTQGSASGGGGGGLVYETGEYKPSADDAQPTINFINTHSDRPFVVLIMDTGGASVTQTDSALYWEIVSIYDAFGVGAYTSTTSQYYARVQYAYKSSSGGSASGNNVTALSGNNNTAMSYYLSNTSFKPYMGSTSRYFRSGRTYKWIAVWAPAT